MIVGILGGGQLARMLAMAGQPLDCRFVFYEPSAECCAAPFGTHIRADYDDWQALRAFAEGVDVLTYEFENVPLASALFVQQFTRLYPQANALEATQDRLREKRLFRQLGIATPEFFAPDCLDDLHGVARELGFPFVIKTRHGGYDGKGQFVVRSAAELAPVWSQLGGRPAIAEQWVTYTREVSIIAARNRAGDLACYDLAENHHEDGILRLTLPRAGDPLYEQARAYVEKLVLQLDYCGVIALELFDVDGALLANEFAPRVHNSGHWTIEGAVTSQFENHLRAILDLPLGQTAQPGYCAMINLIGTLPDMKKVHDLPGGHFHQYDKQPKPGRKLGHITLRQAEPVSLAALTEYKEQLYAP